MRKHVGLLDWWQRSLAARILVVTAAVFLAFAAMLLFVVRHDVAQTVEGEMRARGRGRQGAARVRRYRGRDTAHQRGQARLWKDGPERNSAIVDRVKEVTGADAIVYQVIGGKPIAIASTLMKNDQRVLGRELTGPARDAFLNGKDFTGTSPLEGRPFLTQYATIRNDLGEPIGILYDGVSLDAVNEAVARAFISVFLAAVAAIAVVLVLLWFIVRPLSRDALALARSAEALAEGASPTSSRSPGPTSLAASRARSRASSTTNAPSPSTPRPSPTATCHARSHRRATATGSDSRSPG